MAQAYYDMNNMNNMMNPNMMNGGGYSNSQMNGNGGGGMNMNMNPNMNMNMNMNMYPNQQQQMSQMGNMNYNGMNSGMGGMGGMGEMNMNMQMNPTMNNLSPRTSRRNSLASSAADSNADRILNSLNNLSFSGPPPPNSRNFNSSSASPAFSASYNNPNYNGAAKPVIECHVASCEYPLKDTHSNFCQNHDLILNSVRGQPLPFQIQMKVRYENDDMCVLFPLDAWPDATLAEVRQLIDSHPIGSQLGGAYAVVFNGLEIEPSAYSIFLARYFLPNLYVRFKGRFSPPSVTIELPSLIRDFYDDEEQEWQRSGVNPQMVDMARTMSRTQGGLSGQAAMNAMAQRGTMPAMQQQQPQQQQQPPPVQRLPSGGGGGGGGATAMPSRPAAPSSTPSVASTTQSQPMTERERLKLMSKPSRSNLFKGVDMDERGSPPASPKGVGGGQTTAPVASAPAVVRAPPGPAPGQQQLQQMQQQQQQPMQMRQPVPMQQMQQRPAMQQMQPQMQQQMMMQPQQPQMQTQMQPPMVTRPPASSSPPPILSPSSSYSNLAGTGSGSPRAGTPSTTASAAAAISEGRPLTERERLKLMSKPSRSNLFKDVK